jgi:hypothetical protein
MKSMSDSKTQAAAAISAHAAAIDQLHAKLAALPGCDTERLSIVVEKYKSAHAVFEDDALECVTH